MSSCLSFRVPLSCLAILSLWAWCKPVLLWMYMYGPMELPPKEIHSHPTLPSLLRLSTAPQVAKSEGYCNCNVNDMDPTVRSRALACSLTGLRHQETRAFTSLTPHQRGSLSGL